MMLIQENAYTKSNLFSDIPLYQMVMIYLASPMPGVAHNAVEGISVAGEDVLVLGCGPVGLFAIAIAKALGKWWTGGDDKEELEFHFEFLELLSFFID